MNSVMVNFLVRSRSTCKIGKISFRFEMSENTLQGGKQKCLAKNVKIILPNMS